MKLILFEKDLNSSGKTKIKNGDFKLDPTSDFLGSFSQPCEFADLIIFIHQGSDGFKEAVVLKNKLGNRYEVLPLAIYPEIDEKFIEMLEET